MWLWGSCVSRSTRWRSCGWSSSASRTSSPLTPPSSTTSLSSPSQVCHPPHLSILLPSASLHLDFFFFFFFFFFVATFVASQWSISTFRDKWQHQPTSIVFLSLFFLFSSLLLFFSSALLLFFLFFSFSFLFLFPFLSFPKMN